MEWGVCFAGGGGHIVTSKLADCNLKCMGDESSPYPSFSLPARSDHPHTYMPVPTPSSRRGRCAKPHRFSSL